MAVQTLTVIVLRSLAIYIHPEDIMVCSDSDRARSLLCYLTEDGFLFIKTKVDSCEQGLCCYYLYCTISYEGRWGYPGLHHYEFTYKYDMFSTNTTITLTVIACYNSIEFVKPRASGKVAKFMILTCNSSHKYIPYIH